MFILIHLNQITLQEVLEQIPLQTEQPAKKFLYLGIRGQGKKFIRGSCIF